MSTVPTWRIAIASWMLLMAGMPAARAQFSTPLPAPSTVGREVYGVDPQVPVRKPDVNVPTGAPGLQVPPDLMERKVTFHQVVVEGATAFTGQELEPLFAPLLNKTVAFPEVVAAVNRVSARYEESGYVFFNVILPQQDFSGDKLRVVVIEGYISNVEIQDGIKSEAVRARIASLVGKLVGRHPLKRSDLERQLLLAADTPGASLKAGVKADPSGKLGAVDLVIDGTFERFTPIAQVDSFDITAGSSVNLRAGVIGRSLLLGGDQLELRYVASLPWDRLQLGDVRYSLPVGTDGGRLEFIGQGVWQRPPTTVNGIPVDLLGRSLLGRMQYSQPILRGMKTSLIGIAAVDVIEVNYTLLGANVPGDSLRVLRGGMSATMADDLDGVWAATLLGSVGVNVFNAAAPSRVDSAPTFTKLNASLQRFQTVSPTVTVVAKTSLQLTSNNVPASEVFSFGGRDFGRAFDIASSVGDQGVAVSGEVRYAPEWLRFARQFADPQLYVYGDYGHLWSNNASNLPFFADGASAGAGLRLRVLDKATGEFEVGKVVAGQVAFATEPQPWRFSFRLGVTF